MEPRLHGIEEIFPNWKKYCNLHPATSLIEELKTKKPQLISSEKQVPLMKKELGIPKKQEIEMDWKKKLLPKNVQKKIWLEINVQVGSGKTEGAPGQKERVVGWKQH